MKRIAIARKMSSSVVAITKSAFKMNGFAMEFQIVLIKVMSMIQDA
jgi:hypothetical protein